MDDVIYIIVLIAWVLFAFYRKSQKKKGPVTGPVQPPRPQNDTSTLPTLEEILLGRGPEIKPEPEPVPVPVLSDGMSPRLNETAFEKEYNKLGITSIEELDKPFSFDKYKHAEIQEDEVFIEGNEPDDHLHVFNLRQAVIYSEILDRPYV
jgi:hypothetical protein